MLGIFGGALSSGGRVQSVRRIRLPGAGDRAGNGDQIGGQRVRNPLVPGLLGRRPQQHQLPQRVVDGSAPSPPEKRRRKQMEQARSRRLLAKL